MLRIRTLALSFALVVGIAASANATSISYTVDMGAGSITGSNVTNVVIMESAGGVTYLDFGFLVNSSGQTTLTHDVAYTPTSTLILGLDISPAKTHHVFFANTTFVQNATGVKFSVMFPNTSYSLLAPQLISAEGGDAASLAWLRNFFEGDGAAAAFASNGPNAGVEFTVGTPTVPTPEPSTFVLFGLGAAMTAAFRLRRAKR